MTYESCDCYRRRYIRWVLGMNQETFWVASRRNGKSFEWRRERDKETVLTCNL